MTPSEHAYLDVAIPLHVKGTFTYSVSRRWAPDVGIGMRVLVPFNNRKITGYVLAIKGENEREGVNEILDVLDGHPLFPEQMVPFFEWLSEYYLCPIGMVIQSVLPAGTNTKIFKAAALTEKGKEVLDRLPSHYEEMQLLNWIGNHPGKRPPGPLSRTRFLEKKGWVKLTERIIQSRTAPLFRKAVRLKPGIDPLAMLDGQNSVQRARNEAAFLGMFRPGEPIFLQDVTKAFSNGAYLVKKWIKKGVLEEERISVCRNPAGELFSFFNTPAELHAQQKAVLQDIKNCLDGGAFSVRLLFGVTGSGKTEVYFHAVAHTLRMDRQAIIMVPEIALAVYMEGFFRSRLGPRVAVYHSGLSRGERHDQWIKIVKGEVDLVIGARSALFVPLARLGLIVVDEEHDSAYKQDSNPRYNARDAAVVRAKMENALVILGSGTPSVQSYQNSVAGRYHMLKMPERVEKRRLPEVEIVDMKPPADKSPGKGILSPRLKNAIQENLDAGNQTLLFLNRRGYHRLFMCWSCGKPVSCPNCDVALTYHLEEDRLICHYCGFHAKTDLNCPLCGNPKLRSYGFGTEKLEQDLKKYFPHARIGRMDADSTRKKDAAFRILRRFSAREIDILLGTQMITKGYDFPGVTLVGVIAAELSLGFPDFRAAERTFQILSQVTGRAGRGDHRGRAIIQTFNPDHYAICAARKHDFQVFFKQESQLRKQLGYPPYSHLAVVRVEGNSKNQTSEAARFLKQDILATLNRWHKDGPALQILGPAEAPVSKIKGKYRWQILIKGKRISLIHYLLNDMEIKTRRFLQSKGTRVVLDIDPYQMI